MEQSGDNQWQPVANESGRFESVRGLEVPANELLLLPRLIQKSTSLAPRRAHVLTRPLRKCLQMNLSHLG